MHLPLAMLLECLPLRPSSYHYCRRVLQRPDKYADLRVLIATIAKENLYTYGSPRIWFVAIFMPLSQIGYGSLM